MTAAASREAGSPRQDDDPIGSMTIRMSSQGLWNEVMLHVEYHDEVLRRLAEESAFAPKGWDRRVVISYRKKLQIIYAAKDERDLYAMRGLRLERLTGDRQGDSSIRLNDQFRLILTFRTDGDRVAVILEIVDYH
jgi:proteic killer suppression protein